MRTITARPVVEFDVTNAQHRAWAVLFIKTQSWANCPVMFNRDESFVDLPAYLQSVLIKFYSERDRALAKFGA